MTTTQKIRCLLILIAAVTVIATAADAATTYDVHTDTTIRSTVLFVGDSNITRGAAQIVDALTTRTTGAHLPILGSRVGMGIRGYGPTQCPGGCAASDYWALRIPRILATVTPSVVVVDLGINDSLTAGTATTTGYADYPAKIDWLLALIPAGVPVIWTLLPCPLEPAPYAVGCRAVNQALVAAPAHHPDLTVLYWNAVAIPHRAYMGPVGTAPHYTPAGYTAWARLVGTALDARFPATPINGNAIT